MKKILFVCISFISIKSFSQNLLRENFSTFNSAGLNGQNAWSSSTPSLGNGTGGCFTPGCASTNTAVTAKNMSYAAFSTTTKAIQCVGSGAFASTDGCGKALSSSVNSGSFYIAALINMTDPGHAGNAQVFTVIDNGAVRATRLFVQRSSASTFKLGIDKNSSVASFTNTNYNYGVDMLVVIKYSFNTTSNIDDEVRLYVNPNLAASEPVSADLSINNGTDATIVTRLAFPWNGSSGQVPSGFVGAISVSTSWGTSLPNPFISNIQVNKIANNKASISWDVTTNNEINNFIVQHSTNNSNFSNLGKLDYTGNSTFNQNIDLSNGTNYIRLATVNKQGTTVYSQVFVVKSGNLISGLTISPNPTKGMLLATIKTEERDALQLQILDLQGKLIKQQNSNVEKGETQLNLDVNLLKAGQYILKVVGKTTTESKLFIKQ